MSDNNVDEEPIPKPDYEVGYGRPPKSTQFKPGQSGNPKGRKRKPKSVQAQMQAVLSRKVPINEGGIVKRLPMQQVILRNLASKAAKGDLNAAKFVFTLLHSPEHAVTDTIDETSLSPGDLAMLDEMMKGFAGPDASEVSPAPDAVDENSVPAETPPDQDEASITQMTLMMEVKLMASERPIDEDLRHWVMHNKKLVFEELLRSNFHCFIEKTFRTLNPGTTFLRNWHVEAIAWHLEQVRLGKIKRLIITMPPRSAKSISASVAFPAFVHGWDPTTEIIAVSYAQSLAAKLQNDYRSIISSPWYKGIFPNTRIDPKKDTEQETRLTKRGSRLATSLGGTLTGRGGGIIIIDDPLKPDEAASETGRNTVNQWYGTTLLSRLNQKKDGAIVIVTQRLHVDDLVGHVTEYDDNWTVLNLPAIALEEEAIQVGDQRYYRRQRGGLLHPEREDQAVLDELKLNIGAEAFEAQYQQQPVPPGGNMIKREWLSYYYRQPEITDEDTVFQSWDTASKTGLENDWSVGTTWLLKDGIYYLLDVCREKLNYPALKAKMIEMAERYNPWIILIKDTGVGTGLIEDLRTESLDTVEIKPTQSKEVRAHIQTPKFQSSRVLFPKSAPWLSALEAEVLAFPGGRHDDQVDSIIQALGYEYVVRPSVVWI